VTTVKIDIGPLQGAIDSLTTLASTVRGQKSVVLLRAEAALHPVSSQLSGVDAKVGELEAAAEGLQARLDLAIVVNSGDDGFPTSGVVSYTLPEGASDSVVAVKQLLGEELADATDNPVLTYDAGLFADFQARFARWTDDTTVMPSFYESVTADGLLTFMSAVADDTTGEVLALEKRQMMLQDLQTGLETSSTVWSSFEADGYADALVQAGTHTDISGMSYALSGSKAAALSYLLYDGRYATPFLTSVGEGLDQYERVEMQGTSHLWSNRQPIGYNWLSLFPPESRAANYDPMVGLMSALGNNGEASLKFFSGGDGDDEDSLDDRQKYYIHDRTWTHDQFVHLSEALLAGTTDPAIMSDPGSAPQAAALVANSVNLLGHREAIGYYDAGMFGTDIDHSSAESATNFARMLSPYMYGVDLTLQVDENPAWDKGLTGQDMSLIYANARLDNVPIFNQDSLDTFIALAGGSEDGLAVMREGLNTYAAQKYGLAGDQLETTIDPETGQPPPDAFAAFQNAYASQARMEGVFVNAIGDSEVARAKGEDETRQAWVDLAGGVADVVPVTKLAGGDQAVEAVISFAHGQASSAATDAASEHFATAEEREVDRQNDFADQTLSQSKYAVYQAMGDAGLLPESAFDGPWASGGSLLSWQEFQDLSDQERVEAMAQLNSPFEGGGAYFDMYAFESTYRDQFRDPFG